MKALDTKAKYLSIAIVLVAVLALAYGFGYHEGVRSFSVEYSQPSGPRSEVWVQVIRDGEIIWESYSPNTVQTQGSKRIRDFLGYRNETGNQTTNTTTVIALSNTTDAVDKSWNRLPWELNNTITPGLERINCTGANLMVLNETAYQFEYTFTYTGTETVTVRRTGAHWSAVSMSIGNMMFAASIADAPLSQNDQLKVTWRVNCPDG